MGADTKNELEVCAPTRSVILSFLLTVYLCYSIFLSIIQQSFCQQFFLCCLNLQCFAILLFIVQLLLSSCPIFCYLLVHVLLLLSYCPNVLLSSCPLFYFCYLPVRCSTYFYHIPLQFSALLSICSNLCYLPVSFQPSSYPLFYFCYLPLKYFAIILSTFLLLLSFFLMFYCPPIQSNIRLFFLPKVLTFYCSNSLLQYYHVQDSEKIGNFEALQKRKFLCPKKNLFKSLKRTIHKKELKGTVQSVLKRGKKFISI